MAAPPPPTNRFEYEFETLGTLGAGSFGTVFKVKKRLDGCLYAVKRINQTFFSGAARERVLKEVYALAAVCNEHENPHVVRYFSAWMEDDRLYIQTELCDASLEQYLRSPLAQSIPRGELVRDLLRQLLEGLKLLHAGNVVHLDIKPANIFVKQGVYKLGDMGHAALARGRSASSPRGVGTHDWSLPPPPPLVPAPAAAAAAVGASTVVATTRKGFFPRPPIRELSDGALSMDTDGEADAESEAQRAQALTVVADIDEGDSRYMPRELLMEVHDHLTKADIFSLGASAYEVFLGRVLPANGDEWGAIRDGVLDRAALAQMSDGMRSLLLLMMHPDPAKRPSAGGLLATGGPGGVLKSADELERSRLEKEVQQLRDVAHHSVVMGAGAPAFVPHHPLRRVNTL